jgi:group I intron endonuclease
MQIIGIYKITSPTGKIYIGQSTDIKARWSYYKGLFCSTQRHLYNSLKKHGVVNHTFEIIHVIEKRELNKSEVINELNKLEIHYVALFNSYVVDNNEFGLNLTRGGDNVEISEEGRKRISESKLGIPRSEETKRKCSESRLGKYTGKDNHFYGKTHTEYNKSEMNKDKKIKFLGENNPFYNKKHTEETLQTMRKPKSEEHKLNISKSRKLYFENIRQERVMMVF